jgi:hypothetical protein
MVTDHAVANNDQGFFLHVASASEKSRDIRPRCWQSDLRAKSLKADKTKG